MTVTSRSRRVSASRRMAALDAYCDSAYYNGFATGVAVALLACVAIVAIAALV